MDEAGRWLRVARGPYELIMNFADTPRDIPVAGTEVVLSTVTRRSPAVKAGVARLGAQAGAAVR